MIFPMKATAWNTGWLFRHLDSQENFVPVTLPHDAMQAEPRTELSANGINGGWYEGRDYEYIRRFTPDKSLRSKTLMLEFEGVYHLAEVYLNGEKVAERPYGYTNFYADLTDRVRFDEENELRVIARNSDQPNSRWYSGAGIYRPVVLWSADKQQHIALNGVRIRTVSINPATVEVTVRTVGAGRVSVDVLAGEKQAASAAADTTGEITLTLTIPNAKLWDVEHPNLYTCRVRFGSDEDLQTFGIRTLSWGKKGILLNGERVIVQGACIHHDQGILGARCYAQGEERRVRLLKENGYNAVRSAHNPCSKALLDACDRLGMLMMDEYIDHWYIHKTEYDYVPYFDKWWKQDIADMVDKDYNHPCVILYSTGNEVSETAMLDAIMFGHEYIKKLVEFQDKIVAEIGKEKVEVPLNVTGDDVKKAVREFAYDKCVWVFDTFNRQERQAREAQVKQETIEALAEQFPEREAEIADALYYLNKEVMRKKIIEQGIRPDGRGVTEIRPIWCEVGVLPRVHGSAVFTRGQTQALTVTTLGSTSEGQVLDGLSSEDFKRYIHHYNMPPYATGEAGRLKSPGRREIGHGALAERALLPVIPSEEEFPYAMRLVSEILSSNGSSSMASVCGSTLSLMDAGVPIHAPVAGVAMGLIKDVESGKVAVLTDIQGLEDFLGDMDFKVAGSMNGITAIQMDIKIAGIDRTILETALAQALKGRLFILEKMLSCIGEPRKELSKYAPKIVRFTINPEKIREVIGPGGKMINKIIAETGVKIDIEDDGRVFISTPDAEAADKARRIIEGIAKDIEVGEVYTGKVVRIMNFGAFVELLPGKDGMIHISKLANHRVEKVEDVVKIGDTLEVKVAEIDAQGRVNLVRNDITYDNTAAAAPRRAEGFRARPPRRDGRN